MRSAEVARQQRVGNPEIVGGAARDAIRLHLSWPLMAGEPWREDFYFGAWHPSRPVGISWDAPPASVEPSIVSGANWLLASNTSRCHDGAGLVHDSARRDGDARGDARGEAIAFRGYVLDPPLHSWSGGAPIVRYWSAARSRTHNGVFTAALIESHGKRLRLVTDAWGVSPLYWRRLADGLVLFATSPRFLQIGGDEDEPLAERMFMHQSSLCGDLSFIAGVRRVGPGRIVTFAGAGEHVTDWFSYASLPDGREPLTPQAVELSEDVFNVAVERCARLMPSERIDLPLSSGDDSRRMLVALHEGGRSFEASTVRVLQKGRRDLDARFASEMASHFGFSHTVLEQASPSQFALDDAACRTLFSSEVAEHAWIAPLIRALRPGPSLVFDSLGGDVLGSTGFAAAELHTMPDERKLLAAVMSRIPDSHTRVLRARAWAPLPDVWANVADYLRFLPEGPNRTDLAFLLMRTPRGAGPCMQHLLPPGHVAVYPYLDLDHARATLRFDPLAKLEQTLQARCLQRFWPTYHAFGGRRRIPASAAPNASEVMAAMRRARLHQLRSECSPEELASRAVTRLRPQHSILAVASLMSGPLSRRIGWWLEPFLILESRRQSAVSCWRRVGIG